MFFRFEKVGFPDFARHRVANPPMEGLILVPSLKQEQRIRYYMYKFRWNACFNRNSLPTLTELNHHYVSMCAL